MPETWTPLTADELPFVDHLVTEDDTPVDSLFAEKQRRLLTEPLYSTWSGPGPGRTFLAAANVGVFYSVNQPPVVPDVLLSLDVQVAEDLFAKKNRAYLCWEFGKAPEVALEIVTNLEGEEDGREQSLCARIGVAYYVIWDPQVLLTEQTLRVFALNGLSYRQTESRWLPGVELGLTIWQGAFEGNEDSWLRWCDAEGKVIPTGAERADQEHLEKLDVLRQIEQASHQLEEASRRADRLAEQLRALGIQPEA